MRTVITLAIAALLVGCAGGLEISKTIEAPDGWRYNETVKARGEVDVEELIQSGGGSLTVTTPDGVTVDARLDSQAGADGVKAEGNDDLLVILGWLARQAMNATP